MRDEIATSQTNQDLIALLDSFKDSPDLERLEGVLDRFNIFEATGFVRQELRHSDFLAFLLNPKGTHNLRAAFAKGLLERVMMDPGDVLVPVTLTELKRWDLGRTEIRREWLYIDILLLDQDHELAVIIENKIDSSERPGQLQRYLEVVTQHYPGYRLLPVYLTPDGVTPSHERYLPMDYGLVREVIDDFVEDRASIVSPDLKVLLEHYSDMLRRNIVTDSDVARLCRDIYLEHKRALDLIYDHRPDPQEDIGNLLIRLIDSDVSVTYKRRTKKTYIYFYSSEWGTSPYGSLDFVFHNLPGQLDLYVEVSWADEAARRRLFDVAREHESLFGGYMEKPGTGLNPKLYRRTFLTRYFYEETSEGDREEQIRKHWEEFLKYDLPEIDNVLSTLTWVWGQDETGYGQSSSERSG